MDKFMKDQIDPSRSQRPAKGFRIKREETSRPLLNTYTRRFNKTSNSNISKNFQATQNCKTKSSIKRIGSHQTSKEISFINSNNNIGMSPEETEVSPKSKNQKGYKLSKRETPSEESIGSLSPINLKPVMNSNIANSTIRFQKITNLLVDKGHLDASANSMRESISPSGPKTFQISRLNRSRDELANSKPEGDVMQSSPYCKEHSRVRGK